MALTNAPVEGPDVHPLDKIDHDRLSPAEEGALEVSEHLERQSAKEAKAAAVPAATRRASTSKTSAASKTAARPAKKTAAAKTAGRGAGGTKRRTATVPPRGRAKTGPAGNGERARDVAAELLKKAPGGEMGVAELAAKVVKSGRTRIGGKTPAATVSAQIYTAAKSGVLFKKTSRGRVALLKAKA